MDECEICTATRATIALNCARQWLARAVFGPITECLYGDTFTTFILHRIVIFQLFSGTRRVLVSLTTAILSSDLILFKIALVLTVSPEVALQRIEGWTFISNYVHPPQILGLPNLNNKYVIT